MWILPPQESSNVLFRQVAQQPVRNVQLMVVVDDFRFGKYRYLVAIKLAPVANELPARSGRNSSIASRVGTNTLSPSFMLSRCQGMYSLKSSRWASSSSTISEYPDGTAQLAGGESLPRPIITIRNRPAEFFRRLDPLLNNPFYIRNGLLSRPAVSHAARQVGDGCQVGIVRFAPLDNQSRHLSAHPMCNGATGDMSPRRHYLKYWPSRPSFTRLRSASLSRPSQPHRNGSV